MFHHTIHFDQTESAMLHTVGIIFITIRYFVVFVLYVPYHISKVYLQVQHLMIVQHYDVRSFNLVLSSGLRNNNKNEFKD